MPQPASLVHQQSTSSGAGNISLVAVTGRRTFADAYGTGATTDVFPYFAVGQSDDLWEYGYGHCLNATTLVRDTIIKSSNANAPVDFAGGIVDVMCDTPAENQVRNEGGTNTDGDLAVMDGTTGRKIKSAGVAVSNDGTFEANSDAKLPTEKAVKTYIAGRQLPAFSVSKSADQTGIPSATLTQITFDTEVFDVGGYFASSAWTPFAGLVMMTASLNLGGTVSVGNIASIAIYKNGVAYRRTNVPALGGANQQAFPSITILERANGTDVYTVYGLLTTNSGTVTASAAIGTFFQGVWLAP